MTALFTAEEMLSAVQRAEIEATTAALLVDMASATVRTYVKQTLTTVTGDAATLYGDGSTMLILPETPVTGVTSVTVGGTGASGSGTDITAEAEWTADGQLRYVAVAATPHRGAWYYPWQPGVRVDVVYDHGYATVPADVKAVAIELAQSLAANSDGIIMERIGDYQVTWAQGGTFSLPGRMGLNRDQKERLDPYRQMGDL